MSREGGGKERGERGGVRGGPPGASRTPSRRHTSKRGFDRVLQNFGAAGRRIRWRVLSLTPKTPGHVASTNLVCDS